VIRDDLFPEIASRRNGFMDVGDGHAIYWEESGARDGIPVVFLHGGPGSGTSPTQRRFFDPRAYRIILFDQRGAGRSTPRASLVANTTPDLIADMERLREFLGIDAWLLFGGSWGATLALAYGQAHPDRSLGFVLRGVFLGRAGEIQWFMSCIRSFFPEVWRTFAEFIPEAERGDLLAAYYRRLTSPAPEEHLPAARHWAQYEASCSALLPEPDLLWSVIDTGYALSLARSEAHYFKHGMFLPPGGLLAGMDRVMHLPATIVQGRYDMICPPSSADALARVWRGTELVMVPDAGHAAMEPGIRRALVRATERLKSDLRLPAGVR
jgi:proline iminopeptidase